MKDDNTNKRPKLKGKRKKNYQEKIADYLVSKYDENKRLREKKISTSFLKFF